MKNTVKNIISAGLALLVLCCVVASVQAGSMEYSAEYAEEAQQVINNQLYFLAFTIATATGVFLLINRK